VKLLRQPRRVTIHTVGAGDLEMMWILALLFFPVEHDQVHVPGRGGAQLTQHRRNLATMVAAVIDHMLHHLPEHIRSRCPTHVLILDRTLDAFRSQPFEHFAHLPLQPGPLLARGGSIRNAFRILKSKGLLAVPSPYPDGLGITDVRDGVANRTEAVAERLGELLRRERRNGVENPVACPVVVVDEEAEVVVVHEIQLMRSIGRYPVAYYRSAMALFIWTARLDK
jgi:hypothetical protein